MTDRSPLAAFVLGLLLCAGLIGLGTFLAGGIIKFRDMERSVQVKGLSEREVPADIAIWPIRYQETSQSLNALFSTLNDKNATIVAFLKEQGFDDEAISVAVPNVQDRQAQGYSEDAIRQARYAGSSTVTVYSTDIDRVRSAMNALPTLGQAGIAITGQDYEARTQFLFTGLNAIKPAMIEEATRNAREVAEKFAHDSDSRLGKIKRASQGQFSIEDRDSNTPHIKKVRIVSTIEYELTD